MYDSQKPGMPSQLKRLRSISVYLRESFRFFELKNRNLAVCIFSIMFFIGFAADIFAHYFIRNNPVLYNVLTLALVLITAFFLCIYLDASISELRGREASFGGCASRVLRKLPRLLGAGILYQSGTLLLLIPVLVIPALLFLLIIPAIIFNITFIFFANFILDKDMSVINSLKASRTATSGIKGRLFVINLVVVGIVTGLPFVFILVAASMSSVWILTSITAGLAATFFSLLQLRLVSLLYVDLVSHPSPVFPG